MKTPIASPIVVIAGPTAAGKTAVSVDIAERLGAEIVSADSVQVYRRLDIGAAKPSDAERRGIAHHCLDVVNLDEPFDAAQYVAVADDAIASIRARGHVPLVVGGTGLYLRALIRGLAAGIPSDPAVRGALNARASRGGNELTKMYAELLAVDPEYARKVHPNDPIRVVRALEVHALSKEPLSLHHARHAAQPPRYDALVLALDVDPKSLRERIERRSRDMIAAGFVEEVRGILADGYSPSLKPLRSVGYAQVVAHVLESRKLEETIAAIVGATVSFAKRQRTWFRGEASVRWLSAEALQSAETVEKLRRQFG